MPHLVHMLVSGAVCIVFGGMTLLMVGTASYCVAATPQSGSMRITCRTALSPLPAGPGSICPTNTCAHRFFRGSTVVVLAYEAACMVTTRMCQSMLHLTRQISEHSSGGARVAQSGSLLLLAGTSLYARRPWGART